MEPLPNRARAELGLRYGIPNLGSPTHELRFLEDGSVELVPATALRGLTTDQHLPGDPGQPFLVGPQGEPLGWPIHPSERDDVAKTLDGMGSKWRPATQALHDVATGRATILTQDAVNGARPFRQFADAIIGSMLVEGAATGAKHVPRAPRTTQNTAELLVRNEKYLPRLYHDLEHATDSITISQFNWEDNGSGRRVIDILKHKAQHEHLDVRVMIDAYGFRERGWDVARSIQNELEAAGVKVERSWPFLPRQGWEHRKLITIDDAIAYAGGLGFGAKYDSWTDLMVRMEGPAGAVAGAHGLTTWRDLAGPLDARAAGRLQGIEGVLEQASLARAMGTDAGSAITLLENRPGIDLAATESFIRDARAATHQLWATSTYITTPVAANELIAAARAGSDVKLVVTGLGAANDTRNIKFARTFYKDMLDAGVEIYERQDGVMHAKSMLSAAEDRAVTTVGSMNMSQNSMKRAREVMARIEDADFADSYRAFHTELREACQKVTYADLDSFSLRALTVVRKLLRLKS
jgi:cardiolipin synthase